MDIQSIEYPLIFYNITIPKKNNNTKSSEVKLAIS